MVDVALPQILYLALVSLIAILYSRMRPIVILPALMIGSLFGMALNLEIPELLTNLSPFALALLVFIAGVELDIDFVRREKERILLFIFFEIAILLAMYIFLRAVMIPEMALTLAALMIASNEAFAYEYGKKSDKDLANYGIAISVLEDSVAVFLSSIGYFTLGLRGISREAIYGLIAWSVVVLAITVVLARWINKIVRGAEEKTKLLTVLLYMLILISLSELLHLPEALIVFIGAISMAIQGLDKPVFEVLEGLMTLALMGFVMVLPYEVSMPKMVPMEILMLYLYAMGFGLALAFLAFAFRAVALFTASFLSGMSIVRGLRLSIVLANTGEFGLLVLATLLEQGVKLPLELALGAMFAYAFNLTLLNFIGRKVDGLVEYILDNAPESLMRSLFRIHEEIVDVINDLVTDAEFKQHVYQLALIISLTYILSFLFNLRIGFQQVFLISLFSSMIAAIYIVIRRMARGVKEISKLDASKAFNIVLRAMILYMVVLPIISIADEYFERGIVITFSNPISFVSVILLSATIVILTDKLFSKFTGDRSRSSRDLSSRIE